MAYHAEVLGLTLEALGVTLEANGLHYCSPWVHIEMLVPLGSILGSRGCPNLPKRDPMVYRGCVILHMGCIVWHKDCIMLHRGCIMLRRGCIMLYRSCITVRVLRRACNVAIFSVLGIVERYTLRRQTCSCYALKKTPNRICFF